MEKINTTKSFQPKLTDDSRKSRSQILICDENTIKTLKKYAQILTVFLHEMSPLMDAYVLDYFVENHWEKLPLSWQTVLLKLELCELGTLLNSGENIRFKEIWPLSLQAFRAAAFSLALPRNAVNSFEPVEEFLNKTVGYKNLNTVYSEWKYPKDNFIKIHEEQKKMIDIFFRHVKPKKCHEIVRLAELVNLVTKTIGMERVIDVGSGKGHLSRLLCFQYKLKVATIEAEQSHISEAACYDKQVFSSLQKQQKKNSCDNVETTLYNADSYCELPKHLEGYITLESPKDYFQKIASETWGIEKEDAKHKSTFGVLGLHTCGNLASSLLKLFSEASGASALLSVGCCYMKLNTGLEYQGYPLSDYVNKLPHHNLSYQAREMACHGLEGYIQRLKENDESLKIHCYRAALEKIIVKYYPDMKHVGLSGVKHVEKLQFHEYVYNALKNCSLQIPSEDILSPVTESNLQHWKKVVAIYSLRLLTAPIVESLILLDRMLFLLEKGCTSCIFPVFDPALSPRNHVLLSIRKFNHS